MIMLGPEHVSNVFPLALPLSRETASLKAAEEWILTNCDYVVSQLNTVPLK